MSLTVDSIPAHLPGEPLPPPATTARTARVLARRLLLLVAAVAVSSPAWLTYMLLRLGWPRPPQLPSLQRTGQHLYQVLTARPPDPGLPLAARFSILLDLLTRFVLSPFLGAASIVDDLLYGRQLDAVHIQAPLIELSAARSGSTRLARYLEVDPEVVAPSMLQMRLPFVWLWRLAAGPLGGLVSAERIRRLVEKDMPEEFLRRHEFDPFRTDTLEVVFGLSHHIDLIRCLGPEPFAASFSHSYKTTTNSEFWSDALAFIDRVGRKALFFAGPEAKRLMIKGHFLAIADDLALAYPNARFLNVVRRPESRLQSFINFHRSNPSDELLGPVPWEWIVANAMAAEPVYCEVEQEWFTRAGPIRRCSVPFEAYVRDLSGTLARVYRECLDRPAPPPGLPQAHTARPPDGYRIDRSLEQLGVDADALMNRLSDYTAWAEGRIETPGQPDAQRPA